MENLWNNILADFEHFTLPSFFATFMILFVSIDIIGAIPIALSLKEKGKIFHPSKVAIISAIMFIAFLFIGEPLLGFFGVDVSSFAVAGSIVLFVLAVEMIFGIQVFQDDDPSGNADIVPLVFPLFAGAASFTAILTMRSSGTANSTLFIAIMLNVLCIYLMLRTVSLLERWLGKGGIYILRKFFGVILLAISVKFFMQNLMIILEPFFDK